MPVRHLEPYGITVSSVRSYGGEAREMAKAVKETTNAEALGQAAREMAPLVPPRAVLVPAPSSHGL